MTAQQVIVRIKEKIGVPWREEGTVDIIKAGSPDTVVTGIATTMVATYELLNRASAAGRNMVIVHEPTFYNGTAEEAKSRDLVDDRMFAIKNGFIEKNKMVVWRFHDHWHRRQPDGIINGMTKALGWEKYRTGDDVRTATLPSTTLENLAIQIRGKLKVKTMRVVGDPKTVVSKVAFNPGSTQLRQVQRYFSGDEIDVFVCGELSEWSAGEYARDSIASGKKKGLIILGHDMSEEQGMAECAVWLKTIITEVPVEFMAAGEAFWTPKGA